MRLLADENVPRSLVMALRAAGHDVAWVKVDAPAGSDVTVLGNATRDRRLLLTFDKDFGELAARIQIAAPFGVILVRLRASPTRLADSVIGALAQHLPWPGHFAVLEAGRIRLRPLAGPTPPPEDPGS